MEEKNKLVAEMRLAKRTKTITTIAEIVKKYCGSFEIDTQFLDEYATKMSAAHSAWCNAEEEYDKEEDRTYYRDRRTEDAYDRYRDAEDEAQRIASDPKIIDIMSKVKYVIDVISKKQIDYAKMAEYQKYNMDLFISAISDNPNADSDNEVEHESAMLYPEYRGYADSYSEAVALVSETEQDLETLTTATLDYETDAELFRAAYDQKTRYYWAGYEKAVEERVKQIRLSEMQKGGKK